MGRSLLDSRTSVGATIGDLIFAPVEQAGISPLVVDAGARNGMFLLPESYTRRAKLVGFEPNAVEHQKLVANDTDAQRYFARQGVTVPRFKEARFHDCALWDNDQAHTLYHTRGTGAFTLMGPVRPMMRDVYYLYPEGHKGRRVSFYDLHAAVESTSTVACRRLDQLMAADETVDFLKIDVEGAELRVLRGADNFLSQGRVLFIQSEFQMFPYYEEHPLLCDQHRYLADRGFRLIDLVFDHPRYRRGKTDISQACERGLLFAGDAIFVRDPDQTKMSPIELHRLAALALVFRFSSFGLSLLRDARLLGEPELDAIEQAIRNTPIKSWKGRLAERWANFPYAIHQALSRLASPLIRNLR